MHGLVRTLPPAEALAETVALIGELGRQRKLFARSIERQQGAATAFVRRACGWRADLPERRRASINARARRIAKRALAGRTQSPADASIIAMTGSSLEVVRRSLAPLLAAKAAVEAEMRRAAAALPVAAWVRSVPGVGMLGQALVIAEAGDVGSYRNAGCLWRRFGLAPHRGRALSTWRRIGGLSDAEWERVGYAPSRAGLLFGAVTTNLLRQAPRAARPETRDCAPGYAGADVMTSRLAARDYAEVYQRAKAKAGITHPDWPPRRRHLHAMRLLAQRFLRDLRAEWRRAVREGGRMVAAGSDQQPRNSRAR